MANDDAVLRMPVDVGLPCRRDQERLFDALHADARLQVGHVAHLPAWIVRIRMQILDAQILYGDAHDPSLEFRFRFRLAEITER